MKISKLLNIVSRFLSILAIMTILIYYCNVEVSADNSPVLSSDYEMVDDPTSTSPKTSKSGVGFAEGDLRVYTPTHTGPDGTPDQTQNFSFGKQLQFVSRKWNFVPYSDGNNPVDNASILQNSVIVADSRGAEHTGWNLDASITPFTNDRGDTQDIESLNIESSTVYAVKNFYEDHGNPIFESVQGMTTAPSSNNPVSIKPFESTDTKGLLKDDVPTSATVMSASKDEGTGVWGLCFNKMNLYTGPTSGQTVGNYRATINWTLSADSTM